MNSTVSSKQSLASLVRVLGCLLPLIGVLFADSQPALAQPDFAPAVNYPAAGTPYAVALGDFDEVNGVDIAVVNINASVLGVMSC